MPETLRQLVSRGPVDPSTALNILGQLLKALEFAHWRGIIYRDITPENIVLTSTGQATLAEFVIAPVGDDRASTQADTAAGTSGYAAPEQIYGDPVDERTDIFALGVVAYEMFTGQHPFGASDGLSSSSVIAWILYKPPLEIPQATLAVLPRHIPPVLDVALAKDPKDRFRDATSFRDALNGTAAVADVVVPGKPPLPRAVSRRSFRSKRKWLTYAALGGLVVVALVVLVIALGGNLGASSSTTVTSEGTTSTGQSVPAVAPTTTTTSVAPTTTITSTTTSTTTTSTTSTTTTTITPTRYEQTEPNLLHTGTWATTANGSASGTSFLFANSSGASVTVTFEGTYLAWIAKKSPVYGEAKVTLDDRAPVTVDLYSATTLWQEKAWETGALDAGTHTVTIEWAGAKNAAATDTNISVDAFDVAGSLTQVP